MKHSLEFWLTNAFIIFYTEVLWLIQIEKLDFIWEKYFLIICLAINSISIVYLLLSKKCRFTFSLSYICIFLLVILGILSCIFSKDIAKSLWGSLGRYESIFVIFSYYGLFIIASFMDDAREKLITARILLCVGSVSCMLGIIAGLGGLNKLSVLWVNVAAIPFGNPNFYASMSSMVTCAFMAIFVYSTNRRKYVIGLVGTIFGFASNLSSDSSSAYVSMIMFWLIVLFHESLWRKQNTDVKRFHRVLKRVAVSIGLFGITFVVMNIIRDGASVDEMRSNYSDLLFWMDGNGNRLFSLRMGIWKTAVHEIPKYWLTGAGIDNFQYVMQNAVTDFEYASYFDKAHNEYLNLLLTEGIFAVATYITFLFSLYIPKLKAWKNCVCNQGEDVKMIFFFSFFGYVAQAFFNISVIQVAPFFWILCGLCL